MNHPRRNPLIALEQKRWYLNPQPRLLRHDRLISFKLTGFAMFVPFTYEIIETWPPFSSGTSQSLSLDRAGDGLDRSSSFEGNRPTSTHQLHLFH